MGKVVNNEMKANSLADNKIQAKIPEVGDVYESGYSTKILVVQVWEYNNGNGHADCIAQTCRGIPFYLEVVRIPLGDFEFLTYIGKNTTESKDLFKTENE